MARQFSPLSSALLKNFAFTSTSPRGKKIPLIINSKTGLTDLSTALNTDSPRKREQLSPARQRVQESLSPKKSERPLSVDTGGFAERPRPHVPCALPLDKQTFRHQYKRASFDTHPSRFVRFNTRPDAFSKTQRVRSFNFDKFLYPKSKQESHNLQYDYEYKLLKPKTGIVPNLGKMTQRKVMKLDHINDLSYDKISYKWIDGKRCVPNMDATPARPEHKHLPSFMLVSFKQKQNDRSGMNMTTDFSLKQNCYANTDFLPQRSTFKLSKTYNNIKRIKEASKY